MLVTTGRDLSKSLVVANGAGNGVAPGTRPAGVHGTLVRHARRPAAPSAVETPGPAPQLGGPQRGQSPSKTAWHGTSSGPCGRSSPPQSASRHSRQPSPWRTINPSQSLAAAPCRRRRPPGARVPGPRAVAARRRPAEVVVSVLPIAPPSVAVPVVPPSLAATGGPEGDAWRPRDGERGTVQGTWSWHGRRGCDGFPRPRRARHHTGPHAGAGAGRGRGPRRRGPRPPGRRARPLVGRPGPLGGGRCRRLHRRRRPVRPLLHGRLGSDRPPRRPHGRARQRPRRRVPRCAGHRPPRVRGARPRAPPAGVDPGSRAGDPLRRRAARGATRPRRAARRRSRTRWRTRPTGGTPPPR